MAWLAWVGDRWMSRKAQANFLDSEDAGAERWHTSDPIPEDTTIEYVSSTLDIDLSVEPPVDFFSSSFDLLRGLTVTELPPEKLPASVKAEWFR